MMDPLPPGSNTGTHRLPQGSSSLQSGSQPLSGLTPGNAPPASRARGGPSSAGGTGLPDTLEQLPPQNIQSDRDLIGNIRRQGEYDHIRAILGQTDANGTLAVASALFDYHYVSEAITVLRSLNWEAANADTRQLAFDIGLAVVRRDKMDDTRKVAAFFLDRQGDGFFRTLSLAGEHERGMAIANDLIARDEWSYVPDIGRQFASARWPGQAQVVADALIGRNMGYWAARVAEKLAEYGHPDHAQIIAESLMNNSQLWFGDVARIRDALQRHGHPAQTAAVNQLLFENL